MKPENLVKFGLGAVVTRTYKSPQMVDQLRKVRACFNSEVPNLAEIRGSHPKWQLVNTDDQGKWEYYNLK